MHAADAPEGAGELREFVGEPTTVASRAGRPQSLIITTYGAYSRPLGGWFPVSTLLALMAEVGVEDHAVRSAVARFKRKGTLLAERRDGLAGYLLGPAAWRTFDLGDERILGRRAAPPDDGWLLVAFSVPESVRKTRYRLRSRLSRIGFAQVAGGLWIAPRGHEADARFVVESLGVQEYVDVFTAQHLAYHATPEAVRQWWDLDAIAARHQDFVDRYRPMARRYARGRGPLAPAEAFADYTRLLTSWRPLPYWDPGLPPRYLPPRWVGHQARDLFFTLHDRLADDARRHVEELYPAGRR